MPTARGWLTVATGVAVWAAGRIFGSAPLEQLGFAFVVLVVIALAVVRLGRHDLDVKRTVTPARVPSGRPVSVELRIHNRGLGPAPLVLLEDRMPTGMRGRARFALPGIESDGHRQAAVTLKTARRGRYEVGPLEIIFVDPFGLARIRSHIPERTGFIVHPRVEPLGLPRDTGERRSVATSALRQPTVARGEDFFTLREYAEGDDLRKIHWPSTAKRGRLMLRQEETPWHTRATILLDDRLETHDGVGDDTSFERAVEAAAAFADLYHRSGYGFRIVTAHSDGVPSGRGSEHLGRCLDLLAAIEPRDHQGVDPFGTRLAELESGTSAEAALIVIAGSLGGREAVALNRCRRRYRQITAISFPAHRFGSLGTKERWEGEKVALDVARLLERAGTNALVLGPDESLSGAWSVSRSPRRGRSSWARKPERV